MIVDTYINSNIPQIHQYINPNSPIGVPDKQDHGSHIAGIIAAEACPGVEIIPCIGAFDYHNDINCLKLALYLKVDVVNFSMGGYSPVEEEFNAIKALDIAGIQVICAAGNDNFDIDPDIKPYYPASYDLSNITAVGALLSDGQKADFSNYGQRVVWENGVHIKSFDRFGRTMLMSGTSQATAVYTSKIVREFCKENGSI